MTDAGGEVRVTEEGLSHIKSEAAFLMDKTFQVSFGYFGVLAALFAITGVDSIRGAAAQLPIPPAQLFALAIMVLNTIYLTIGAGCVFGILKRGYFLMLSARSGRKEGQVLRDWEVFVRRPQYGRHNVPGLGKAGWNTDNYFLVLPMYVVPTIASLIAVVFLMRSGQAAVLVATWVAVAFHIVPAYLLYQAHKLDQVCREQCGP